ncbi:hypothetical protein SAMN05216571_1083 [Onishia taeanensis]|uniref:Uncharacterized protein n=1 Tax=Onishia taeanensis TaxID=284577 RepID=A0A1G7SVQ8_9GAMM|nr:hypothetical protein SAMN05216571_1083 [Halomonas taeanensis]
MKLNKLNRTLELINLLLDLIYRVLQLSDQYSLPCF